MRLMEYNDNMKGESQNSICFSDWDSFFSSLLIKFKYLDFNNIIEALNYFRKC